MIDTLAIENVDFDRFDAVLVKLHQQSHDAASWRDKCLRYFQTLSKRPIPPLDPPPVPGMIGGGVNVGLGNQPRSFFGTSAHSSL